MRRVPIYLLAAVGVWHVVGLAKDVVRKPGPDHGVRVLLRDSAGMPLRTGSVFVDRGRGAIDRFTADSSGVAVLPVSPLERAGIRLLICVPAFLPFSAINGGADVAEYEVQLMRDDGQGSRFVRSNGWYGPIPRECPNPADSVGWLVPRAGMRNGAIVYDEPEWPRQRP